MTDEQLQRIHDIEYSCDSREELAERIVGLEDKLAMYENDHQIALRTYGSWKRLKAEVPKLREENAKLVDVLHEVEEEAVLAYHGLQSDIELLIKSETEFFEKWWHSECRNDNKLKRIEVLDAENAKLREQVHWLKQGDILHVLTDQELADQQKHEREVQASITALDDENAKLREVIDDITEVVEVSDPALVQFIAKRMERAGIEVES